MSTSNQNTSFSLLSNTSSSFRSNFDVNATANASVSISNPRRKTRQPQLCLGPPRRPLSLIVDPSSSYNSSSNKRKFSTASDIENVSLSIKTRKVSGSGGKGHKATKSEIITRSASNVLKFEHLLKDARESFERMDWKTSERMCNEIIEAENTDITPFLLLRSSVKGKKNDIFGAFDDAKRAQRLKRNDPECHLRLAQTHLAIAMHHTEASIGLHSKNQLLTHSSSTSSTSRFTPSTTSTLRSLSINKQSLSTLQSQYSSSSIFKRLPLSIISSKIVPFCGSKELLNLSNSCGYLRGGFGTELFENFRFQGGLEETIKGLHVFEKRSGGKGLKIVDVEVKEMDEEEDLRAAFGRLLYTHRDSLVEVKVGHNGAMDGVLNRSRIRFEGEGREIVIKSLRSTLQEDDSVLEHPFESSVILRPNPKSDDLPGESFLSSGFDEMDPNDSGSSMIQHDDEIEEEEDTSNSSEEMNRWLAKHLAGLKSNGVLQGM